MSLTLEQRIETFLTEWNMREFLLKAGGYSDKEIATHRKDILHRYQLTEDEVKNARIR